MAALHWQPALRDVTWFSSLCRCRHRFGGLILSNSQKSLHQGGFLALFSFLLSRASLLSSGAKVKEEAENSSIHACVTLSGKNVRPVLKSLHG
jgi:hypothetical protein